MLDRISSRTGLPWRRGHRGLGLGVPARDVVPEDKRRSVHSAKLVSEGVRSASQGMVLARRKPKLKSPLSGEDKPR